MRLILTYYGREWKGLWSGTLDVFDKLFPKQNNISCVKWVRIFPCISIVYQKFLVLYSKLFYTSPGICREKQMYSLTIKTAIHNIMKIKCDWVLMVAEHCLTNKFPRDRKYACYIDTDFPVTARLDYASNKLGFNYYVSHYDKYTAMSYERMDVIFTQNEWTRQSVIKRFNLSPGKVINVRFGVNVEPYKGNKDYSKNLLLIVLRQYNAKTKGLDLLVNALPLIRNTYPYVKLAVVGNDEYRKSEGVETYVGYPRSKTKELFREATLYVMPSRNEPNGITYLEALCNKTPFVALNRFAAPEFSNNGEWSFLCNGDSPEDLAGTVIDALSDKARLKAMGEKGQKFVLDNYSWDKTVAEMCKVMEDRL